MSVCQSKYKLHINYTLTLEGIHFYTQQKQEFPAAPQGKQTHRDLQQTPVPVSVNRWEDSFHITRSRSSQRSRSITTKHICSHVNSSALLTFLSLFSQLIKYSIDHHNNAINIRFSLKLLNRQKITVIINRYQFLFLMNGF